MFITLRKLLPFIILVIKLSDFGTCSYNSRLFPWIASYVKQHYWQHVTVFSDARVVQSAKESWADARLSGIKMSGIVIVYVINIAVGSKHKQQCPVYFFLNSLVLTKVQIPAPLKFANERVVSYLSNPCTNKNKEMRVCRFTVSLML